MGVEFAHGEATMTAHALGNLREFTRRFGMAACGLPAEYLTLVPELPWEEVGRTPGP